jgi:hypothetical protein
MKEVNSIKNQLINGWSGSKMILDYIKVPMCIRGFTINQINSTLKELIEQGKKRGAISDGSFTFSSGDSDLVGGDAHIVYQFYRYENEHEVSIKRESYEKKLSMKKQQEEIHKLKKKLSSNPDFNRLSDLEGRF